MEIVFEQDILMTPYQRIEDIVSGKEDPVTTSKDCDMEKHGYTRIGTARVTATLFSRDDIVQNKIKALQQKLENERAESQQRQNFILSEISKLQALTFEPA